MTDTPLEGRVAFITGTSRGIGKQLALALADAGASIVSTGKTVDEHERLPGTIVETAEAVRERGGEAIHQQLDVRDEASVDAAVERTVEEFGSVDVCINNAGAIHFAPVADTPAKRFDLLTDVNVRGAHVTTRACLPYMREQGWGHVVSMSPPLGMATAPGKAPYAWSKLGMSFLSNSLAAELESEPVGVNALWPVAAIETEATRHFQMGTPEDWRSPEIVSDAVLEILSRDPREFSGNELYDEELLREAGVSDFSRYNVVEDASPGPNSARLFDPEYERPV